MNVTAAQWLAVNCNNAGELLTTRWVLLYEFELDRDFIVNQYSPLTHIGDVMQQTYMIDAHFLSIVGTLLLGMVFQVTC